jgi:hypothetical protein
MNSERAAGIHCTFDSDIPAMQIHVLHLLCLDSPDQVRDDDTPFRIHAGCIDDGDIEDPGGDETDLKVKCKDGDESGGHDKRRNDAYTDNISIADGETTDMQGFFRHNHFRTFELFLFNRWQLGLC